MQTKNEVTKLDTAVKSAPVNVAALDPNIVTQFLTMNPDFFNKHEDLLHRLRIPHHTGAAVSLVERQVSALRNKCETLEHSLRDFISVATDNEELHTRLHRLIQEVISCRTIPAVFDLTRDNLMSNFNADDVRVVLIKNETTKDADVADHRVMDGDDEGLELFAEIFKKRETFCGELTEEQHKVLFADEEIDAASAAIIPLHHEGQIGMVVLSSKDETRFMAGKGVMFLDQLGEVVSRRVHSLT